MFSEYYESELTYLRQLGRDFSQLNPAIAALLAERSGDPDVERLLEGFAFLTARIRERIDDSVPEVLQSLCQLLLPHYLRPIPATSIVEFTPQGALRGRVKIPRGTEVASQKVSDIRCRFQTTQDVDLLPISLLDANLDRSAAAYPVLTLSFGMTEGAGPEIFRPEGIRLFLAGEYPGAALLAYWFGRHVRRVTVKAGPNATGIHLPPNSVRLPGLAPENALIPYPRFAPPGYRLLQEYFTQPAKFLFVDIGNLDRAIGLVGERFELSIEFDRPPDISGRISRENFRLACAPVVNLFKTSADPVNYDGTIREHLLRASELGPLHSEVHEVGAVIGARGTGAQKAIYRPFNDFSYRGEQIDKSRRVSATPSFVIRRSMSPLDNGIDTFLSVVTPKGVLPNPLDDVLSIDLVCSNRSIPAQIRTGDINVPTPLSPTAASFRNIAPVTPSVRLPLGDELGWRLVSHLALSHRSLAEPGLLRSMLSLYNFQGLEGHADGQTNERRIESVQEVTTRATRRVLEGSPVRGAATRLRCAESGFAGRGDVFLFGCVLDELFASFLNVNEVHELGIQLDPSNIELTWLPRSGQQTII